MGGGRGKGYGTGSPLSFRCYNERSTVRNWSETQHEVELTGRQRPYHTSRYSSRGANSTPVAREYHCKTCGHVGWSNHVNLAAMAGEGRS